MKQIATQTPSLPYHFFEAFPEIWQFLEPSIRRYRCDKGETIIRHGDAAQALWVVQQGWVKLVRQTPDGKETVIGIGTEDDLFGEAALFPHANYPYTAESLEADTLLYTIPSAQLRQALKDHPDFSSRIMAVLNDRMSQTQLNWNNCILCPQLNGWAVFYFVYANIVFQAAFNSGFPSRNIFSPRFSG